MTGTTEQKDTVRDSTSYLNKWYCATSSSPLTHNLSPFEIPRETAAFHFNTAADLFSSPGDAH